ncbi:albumin-like [Mixophyes fleayi]|uniref:albumin-like n=1 Tax=Mixophyes fleayi TaxID=3061075 RepID=UPI003F4D8708
MKWVILICLLICFTVTDSRILPKRDVDHHPRLIGDIYTAIGTTGFNRLVLVLLAQNLQRDSLEEHLKVQADISALAKHCVDHGDDEECKKPLITLFYDKVCKVKDLDHNYPWTKECCPKQDPERNKCFVEHRDVKSDSYQVPNIDAVCKEHKENPEHAYDHYIDDIASRHPNLYPPIVLFLASQYNIIITECCEAEDKPTCFKDRFTELKKTTIYIESQQRQTCQILETFSERVLQALKLCVLSQKYPAADFGDIQKLTLEVVHLNKDCCQLDAVECMIERMELTQHTCDNYEKLSPKLKVCCEKPIMDRTPCILHQPNDDIPADVPRDLTEFYSDEHVCKNLEDQKDIFLAKFAHAFSRIHPELAPQSLLRVASGYEGLLKKCCATENPPECYKNAPQLLEAGIQKSRTLEQENCAAFEKLGPYLYQIQLLIRYTEKMPQVTPETLIEITGKMTRIAGKCCALPEDQRIPCAEEKLDLLLGDMCERQSHTFINDNVKHCCIDSYANRRPCFTDLGPDQSYKPIKLDENNFPIDADFCDASEGEKQTTKKNLLIQLVKLKNDIAHEKLNELINEFLSIAKKCCEAPDHHACFILEKPAAFLHIKEATEH